MKTKKKKSFFKILLISFAAIRSEFRKEKKDAIDAELNSSELMRKYTKTGEVDSQMVNNHKYYEKKHDESARF